MSGRSYRAGPEKTHPSSASHVVYGQKNHGRYYSVSALRLWPPGLVTEAFSGRRQLNRRITQLRQEGFGRIFVEKRHAERSEKE